MKIFRHWHDGVLVEETVDEKPITVNLGAKLKTSDTLESAESLVNRERLGIAQYVAVQPRAQAPIGSGPGTELHRILEKFGITVEPGCQCLKHIAVMDLRGPQWCEDNTDKIVNWLRQEAATRKLPFSKFAATRLVKRAISNAHAL